MENSITARAAGAEVDAMAAAVAAVVGVTVEVLKPAYWGDAPPVQSGSFSAAEGRTM